MRESQDQDQDIGDAVVTEIKFHRRERWRCEYQRNNKQSGVKNLRCFPYCRDPHRAQGFCGQPVWITVNLKNPDEEKRKLFIWAEFLTVDNFKKRVNTTIGMKLSQDDIDAKLRTRKDPFLPWFSGILLDQNSADEGGESSAVNSNSRSGKQTQFHVKTEKGGWNYTWVANKHTCHVLHTLAIYVFAKNETENGEEKEDKCYECIDMHQSPNFLVYCRRRPVDKKVKEQVKVEQNVPAQIYREQQMQKEIDDTTEVLKMAAWSNANKKNEISGLKTETEGGIHNYASYASGTEHVNHVNTLNQTYKSNHTDGGDNLLIPDPFDPLFMKTLEQFSGLQRIDTFTDSSLPYHNRASYEDSVGKQPDPDGVETNNSTNRRRKTKRTMYGDERFDIATTSIDLGRVPMALRSAFPLRHSTNEYSSVPDFNIPLDVLTLFGSADPQNCMQYANRKMLWKIAVILTVLESHWRTYPELQCISDVVQSERRIGMSDGMDARNKEPSVAIAPANLKLKQNSDLILSESQEAPVYADPTIRAAFLELAKMFGSLEYARKLFDEQHSAVTIDDKESIYLEAILGGMSKAIGRVGVDMETFMSLFSMDIPHEVAEAAKQRLRCLNGMIRSNPKMCDLVCNESAEENSVFRGRGEDHTYYERNRVTKLPFNPAGVWRFDDYVINALNMIRSKYLKTNWVLRNIITMMETELKATLISPDEILIQTRAKMMFSSVKLVYKIDGRKHDYIEDKFNVPFGRQGAFVYRAFWEDGALVMETYFGADQRRKLYRKWKPVAYNTAFDSPEVLNVTVGFAEIDRKTGFFETLYEASGSCNKISWAS